MKSTENIQDSQVIKIIGDQPKVAILQLLMAESATLSQLGRALGLHAANIRYHLKELEKIGLVSFVSSREVRGFVEKYYRATAQAYFVNYVLLPHTGKQKTVFSLGSHDLALELLADYLAKDDSIPNLMVLPVGSLDGLIALRQGYCQIAGCHLFDPVGGEYNVSYVRHLFPGQPMHIVTLALREQGFLVAKGNPHKIMGLEDLARDDLAFVNRKKGSGTRFWLDQQMGAVGLESNQVKGYERELNTHSHIAEAVQKGEADFGLAVIAAAIQYDLDFIPLFEERFDLVINDESFSDALLSRALETIYDKKFRQAVSELGGYDTTHTGQILSV